MCKIPAGDEADPSGKIRGFVSSETEQISWDWVWRKEGHKCQTEELHLYLQAQEALNHEG
jgi:hypothetical protein